MYRLLCLYICSFLFLIGSASADNKAQDQLLGFSISDLEGIVASDKKPADLLGLNQDDLDKLFASPSAKSPTTALQKPQKDPKETPLPAATTSPVQSVSAIGMLTGSHKGLYYSLGRDIAKLAAKQGIRVNVKTSSGSLDNIRRMTSNENAGLSIVQSDVIEFLSKNPGAASQAIIKNLRAVFPLLYEEVHLLARQDIQTIADLENKRVIVGQLSTGTPITANNVFDMVDVNFEPVVSTSDEDALKKFIIGDAEALFFVGGKPIRHITSLLEMNNNEKLRKYTEGIHLIPLDDPRLLTTYRKAEITPADYQSKNSTYRLAQDTVPTIAALALLVSYNFSEGNSTYHKHRCEQVGQLNTMIREKLSLLASNKQYSAKWSQVDLDQTTVLAKSQCLTEANPKTNELKAIDCYLKTGSNCQ